MNSRLFWLRASFLAAASVCATAAAALNAGAYGPRITVGDVYQQTSAKATYNGLAGDGCETTATCYVMFQAPARKAVIIDHVACRIFQIGAADIHFVQLMSKASAGDHAVALTPTRMEAGYVTVSQPVLFPIERTERPMVLMTFSTSIGVLPECTISGHVVNP
jgi:hypothetical protein